MSGQNSEAKKKIRLITIKKIKENTESLKECQYSRLINMLFPIDTYYRFYRKWLFQSTKCNHIRNQQANFSQNIHLAGLVSINFYFLAILAKTANISRWFWIAAFDTTLYLLINFEKKNQIKIAIVKCPNEKLHNDRNNDINFRSRDPRDTNLANVCKIIWRKFHQNPSIHLGYNAFTHTYTHPRFHRNMFGKLTET